MEERRIKFLRMKCSYEIWNTEEIHKTWAGNGVENVRSRKIMLYSMND